MRVHHIAQTCRLCRSRLHFDPDDCRLRPLHKQRVRTAAGRSTVPGRTRLCRARCPGQSVPRGHLRDAVVRPARRHARRAAPGRSHKHPALSPGPSAEPERRASALPLHPLPGHLHLLRRSPRSSSPRSRVSTPHHSTSTGLSQPSRLVPLASLVSTTTTNTRKRRRAKVRAGVVTHSKSRTPKVNARAAYTANPGVELVARRRPTPRSHALPPPSGSPSLPITWRLGSGVAPTTRPWTEFSRTEPWFRACRRFEARGSCRCGSWTACGDARRRRSSTCTCARP